MKVIYDQMSHEIVINKSRFIAHVMYVTNVDDANKFIEKINNEYPDARHNCYAYIIGAMMKVSDDGEPTGTAGIPMLDVLKHHLLDNVVVVTTRYFGGIKLGAGGLTRAYAKSVSMLIENANIVELIPGIKIRLCMNHSDINKIDYYLKTNKIDVLTKNYDLKVYYEFIVKKSDLEIIKDNISNINHTINLQLFDENYHVLV